MTTVNRKPRMNLVLPLLMGLLILAGCSAGTEAPFQPTFQGGPRLSIDRSAWDFGEVPAGEYVDPVFQLRNVGDSTLLVEKALTRVVEGCCPAQPQLETMELAPGETSVMTLHFTMTGGMTGPHIFEVLVASNDPIEPEVHVTVKANFVE